MYGDLLYIHCELKVILNFEEIKALSLMLVYSISDGVRNT